MTLTEFLLARIAEDEKLARDALRPRYGSEQEKPDWSYDGNPSGAFTAGAYTIGQASSWAEDDLQGGRFARHIVNWDPARVLTECEAKRRILAMEEGSDDFYQAMPSPNYAKHYHSPSLDVLIRVQQLMALPYANHPDYREEWRP